MNKAWIKAALIRAVKTMAQTAVALLSTGAVGILDVDWVAVLSASALAGVLSVLTSLAGLPEVDMLADRDAAPEHGCMDCVSMGGEDDEDQD